MRRTLSKSPCPSGHATGPGSVMSGRGRRPSVRRSGPLPPTASAPRHLALPAFSARGSPPGGENTGPALAQVPLVTLALWERISAYGGSERTTSRLHPGRCIPWPSVPGRSPPHCDNRIPTAPGCRDIRRRTRVAGLFPNEESLLRLVSTVLMEISNDWETDKRYDTFNPRK